MAAEYIIWSAMAIAGYLLGAFPTAYVLVKVFAGRNVMDWGSGNVGTLNVHRATNSTLTISTKGRPPSLSRYRYPRSEPRNSPRGMMSRASGHM